MSRNGNKLLRKVVVHYSLNPSSQATRIFLESPKLANWLKENPEVEFFAQKRPNPHPFIECEHSENFRLDGKNNGKKIPWAISLRKKSEDEIFETLNYIRNSTSRRPIERTRTTIHQQKKSIQGLWDNGISAALQKE